jgi:hypothetical protein
VCSSKFSCQHRRIPFPFKSEECIRKMDIGMKSHLQLAGW